MHQNHTKQLCCDLLEVMSLIRICWLPQPSVRLLVACSARGKILSGMMWLHGRQRQHALIRRQGNEGSDQVIVYLVREIASMTNSPLNECDGDARA